MSKFLFYTDLHLAAKVPRHRTDIYSQSILVKMREIYQIAQDVNVDFVAFGGDFFNSHRIFSYETINEAMDIMCTVDFKTLAVIGQHDLVGHNQQTYKSSTLAFIERHCPMFFVMDGPVDIGDAVLHPCHWYSDFDECLQQRVTKRKKSILLAHKTITMGKLPYETIRTCDIDCGFNLVLSGDWHSGFEVHEENGTVFYNPGSISRRKITEMDRRIKVGIISAKIGHPVDIQDVFLDNVRPGGEVFDVDYIEEVRDAARMDTSKFVSGIMELEKEAVDIFELVEKAGRQKGIRQEVLDYIATKNSSI